MTPVEAFIQHAYGGDVTKTLQPARPHEAADLLRDHPGLADDADVAWAIGTGQGAGPSKFGFPPLLATTLSTLLQLPAYRGGLHAAVQRLLQSGADPNARVGHFSALYGAAGVNRDLELTAVLLDAGADPNDGESLYHSLEAPAVTALLLSRGAAIAGSNALFRSLDMEGPEALRLLLAHGADPNEVILRGPVRHWRTPLLRALALHKPKPFIAALLEAGADPAAETDDGRSAPVLAALLAHPAAALLPAPRRLTAEEQQVVDRAPVSPDLAPGLRRLLPDAAAWGDPALVRIMVAQGWPIDARGGDWDASALNHAIFRGDGALTEFLLAHGADWREPHGYGDNAAGTLAWATSNARKPGHAVCAEALRRAGAPT